MQGTPRYAAVDRIYRPAVLAPTVQEWSFFSPYNKLVSSLTALTGKTNKIRSG